MNEHYRCERPHLSGTYEEPHCICAAEPCVTFLADRLADAVEALNGHGHVDPETCGWCTVIAPALRAYREARTAPEPILGEKPS